MSRVFREKPFGGIYCFSWLCRCISERSFYERGGLWQKCRATLRSPYKYKTGLSTRFYFYWRDLDASTVYLDKRNFGTSFSAWHQLQHLAYLEANVRKYIPLNNFLLENLLINFRYLYLGKFFQLEHRFRHAKKNPHSLQNLINLSTRILLAYENNLNRFGLKISIKMSAKNFLKYPFRNPLARLVRRIQKPFTQNFKISL